MGDETPDPPQRPTDWTDLFGVELPKEEVPPSASSSFGSFVLFGFLLCVAVAYSWVREHLGAGGLPILRNFGEALVAVWGACTLLLVIGSIGSAGRIHRFFERHRSIGNEADLEAFKVLARRDMKYALAQIALMVVDFFASTAVVLVYLLPGTAAVFGAGLVLMLLAGSIQRQLARVMSLPADHRYQEEYRRISSSWLNLPFPDF